MEDLIVLSKLVSQKKIRQIEIISESSDMSSLSKRLYKGIISDKYQTDEDALLDLYGDKKPSESFKKLKYRLKQRILNTIFFIDVQGYARTEFHKAVVRNSKNFAAFFILYYFGFKKQAISIAENTLKSSLKFDNIEMSLILVRYLRKHYALFEMDTRKAKRYSSLLKQLKYELDIEMETEHLFILLGNKMKRKSSKYDDAVKEIEIEVERYYEKAKSINRFYVAFNIYNCKYYISLLKNDTLAMKEVAQEAVKYFEKKIGFHGVSLMSFSQKLGVALLSEKNYDQSLVMLDKALSIQKNIVNLNWLSINRYKVLNHLLQQKYDDALVLVSNVVNHKKFRGFYDSDRQQWTVLEAYFHYLIKIEAIDSKYVENYPLPNFRLKRFLNDVGVLSKDKEGINIPINIFEILYLMLDSDYEKISKRIASLKQYAYRHLKLKNRSTYFINMLSYLPDYEYDFSRVDKKVSKYFDKLLETPMEITEQSIHVEIVPYEDLWLLTKKYLLK